MPAVGLERIAGRDQPPDLVEPERVEREQADRADARRCAGLKLPAEQAGAALASLKGAIWPVPRTSHL